MHDKWRQDKDRFYGQIYFFISLSIAVISSLFISWISILILLNCLLILLIISANRHKKIKKNFKKNRAVMKKCFKDWGLKFED